FTVTVGTPPAARSDEVKLRTMLFPLAPAVFAVKFAVTAPGVPKVVVAFATVAFEPVVRKSVTGATAFALPIVASILKSLSWVCVVPAVADTNNGMSASVNGFTFAVSACALVVSISVDIGWAPGEVGLM